MIKMKVCRLQCVMMFAVCLALLPACDRVANKPSLAKGPVLASSSTVIQEPGTYKFPSRSENLEIWTDADAIVHYKMTDLKSGQAILSGDAGSKFSRWCLLYSANSWLWVYSGDKGSCVWMPQGGGSYKPVALAGDNELIRQMPQPFFDALPDTLKQSWVAMRDKGN